MKSSQDADHESNWSYSGEETVSTGDSAEVQYTHVEPISWSASEYIAHEKSSSWYLALFAGGGVLVVIVYLVTRDILASIVVLLSCAALSVYAGRKPETKNYTLDEHGITIEGKPYNYGLFRSFSIVEEGAIDSVWLKPLKRLSPMTVMYFSPEDIDRIVDTLSNFLPYEERELDTIDRLSKRVRF